MILLRLIPLRSKEHRFLASQTWVRIPVLPFASHVTLGKWLLPSNPPLQRNAKWYNNRENSLEVSLKTYHMILGIYLREKKLVHTKTCTRSFIAINWKQLKCPTISEWLNKLWSIHTVTSSAALKRNKLLIHRTTWIDLKDII